MQTNRPLISLLYDNYLPNVITIHYLFVLTQIGSKPVDCSGVKKIVFHGKESIRK